MNNLHPQTINKDQSGQVNPEPKTALGLSVCECSVGLKKKDFRFCSFFCSHVFALSPCVDDINEVSVCVQYMCP